MVDAGPHVDTASGARLTPLAILLLASACGETSGARDQHTVQFEDRAQLPTTSETWLFVIDGRDAAEASDLRARFSKEFEEKNSRICDQLDPVGLSPVHRVGVVAFPSPGGTRLVGPGDGPDLLYATNTLTEDGLVRWGASVSNAITSTETPAAANAILATLADSLALLSGTRAPASSAEEVLAQLARPTEFLHVTLVSSTDDESEAEPGTFAITALEPLGTFGMVVVVDAVVPTEMEGPCIATCKPTPRFAAWEAASVDVELTIWQPDDMGSLVNRPSCGSGGRRCVEVPKVLPGGQAACRLFVESPAPCIEDFGWSETALDDGSTDTACEVRQLSGQALVSCQADLSCASCEPGFCFTQVPEVARPCPDYGLAAFPRVVVSDLGRLPGDVFTKVHLVCDAEP